MFLSSLFQKEKRHFDRLQPLAQRLLLSISGFEFVYPLLFVFINAFILRKTNDFGSVAIYNLATFLILPVIFLLNGYLLKKFSMKYLYLFGLVGQGLVVSLLFFFPFTSYTGLFLFGCLQALPMGIYFGNRNFVSLEGTADDHRNYFTGLEMILATIMGVITPVLLGWILVFGDSSGFYSVDQAYRWLSIMALFILAGSGLLLFNQKLDNPKLSRVFLKKISNRWQSARIMEAFRGVEDGMKTFVDTLIIFTFLGKEGALGTIQSISALIAIVVIYVVSSRSKARHRVKMLTMVLGGLVMVAAIFSAFFSPAAAIVYLLSYRLLNRLQWISLNPILLKVIDEEEGGDSTNNYAYIANRELFLNIGRVTGLAIFFGLFAIFSQTTALRFIPLLTAVLQIGVGVMARKLASKRNS